MSLPDDKVIIENNPKVAETANKSELDLEPSVAAPEQPRTAVSIQIL